MMSKKNSNNWETVPRKIFLFLFEEDRSFFINDSTQESNWKYYDGHFRERYTATREQFAKSKKTSKLPPLFLLDTVIGTGADAFQRKIEWSKYFVEQGYKCLAGEKMNEIVREFDSGESEFYESIKNLPLTQFCSPDKNLFPEFKKSSRNKRTKTSKLPPDLFRISVFVREKEYLKYKKKADEYGVPMSEYILDCVRLGGTFQVDTSFMERYIKEIDHCYNLFSGMLATYLISKKYYPTDIIKMEELCKQIADSNVAVKEEIIRLNRQLKRMKTGEQLNTDQLL